MKLLPPSASTSYPLPKLAERYTHPTGRSHTVLIHTSKSGLTPITPYGSHSPFPAPEKRKYKSDLEAYQIWRSYGFRTQRRVEMEAFAPTYSTRLTGAQKIVEGGGGGGLMDWDGASRFILFMGGRIG